MALTIRDPETEQLARELAALTGETLTGTIRVALQERLALKKRRCEATNETKGKLCEHRLTRTLTLKFAEVTARPIQIKITTMLLSGSVIFTNITY
jgi:antitoxin VapB